MLEDSDLNMSEVSPAVVAMWRLIHTLNSEKLAWQRQLQLKNSATNTPRPPPRRKRPFLRSASVDVLVKGYDGNNNISSRDNFIPLPGGQDTNSPGPSQDHVRRRHYEQDMTSLKGGAPAPTGDSASGQTHEADTSSLVEMSASDHQGWLVDQLRGKKVWGAVSQGALNIFETDSTSVPRRSIALQECKVRRLEFTMKTDQTANGVVRHFSGQSMGNDKHQFVVENTQSKLNFAFGVSTKQDLDHWIAALNSASYADIDSKSSEDTGISLDSSIASVESDFSKLRASPELSGIPKTPSPRLRTHRDSLSFSQPQDVKRNSVVEILKRHRKDVNDTEHKNQPLRATHDADEPDPGPPSDSRRKSRSFLKNPFDNLFRRKKRSSSADDARGRRKSSSSEKSKNDSRLSDSFDSRSSQGRDRQNSQGSTSSHSPEVTPRHVERNSSGSVSLSLRRTASDLKAKLFGDHSDENYVGVCLNQLKDDVKVSGFLQYRQDYKYIKAFCVLSRGWLYLFKTDRPDETALLSIRLNQCRVQYVADLEKRKKSLFAFKVSQPECPSVYLVSEDHQSLIKWIMAVQSEASSIQAEKGLAEEIREKKSVQKARVAQELGLSPSDKNLSKQAELRLKRNSCPTFSLEELSMIQRPPHLTQRVPRLAIPSTPEDDVDGNGEAGKRDNSAHSSSVRNKSRLSLHIPDEKLLSSSSSSLRIARLNNVGSSGRETDQSSQNVGLPRSSTLRIARSNNDGSSGRETDQSSQNVGLPRSSTLRIARSNNDGSSSREEAQGSQNVVFHLHGATTEMGSSADARTEAVPSSLAVLPRDAVPALNVVHPHPAVTIVSRAHGTYSQEVKHESERLLQKATATVRRATSLYIPGSGNGIGAGSPPSSASPNNNVFKQRVTSLLRTSQDSPSLGLNPEQSSSPQLSRDIKNASSSVVPTSAEASKLSSTYNHDSSECKEQCCSKLSPETETVNKGIQQNRSCKDYSVSKDTKYENSTRSDFNGASSPSTANHPGSYDSVNRYSFESSVHDGALKDSWSTDEGFLLAILNDQLRQRRQRGSADAVSSSSDDTVLVFNDDAPTKDQMIKKTKMDSEETSESSDSEKITSTLALFPPQQENGGLSGCHAQMQGFVEKRGYDDKWTRYWCVLREACLYFYLRADDKASVDVTELTGYGVTELIDSFPGKPFILKFDHKDYVSVTLSLDCHPDMCEWFQAIKAVLTSLKRDRAVGCGSVNMDEKGKQMSPATRTVKEKLLAEILRQKQELEKMQTARNNIKKMESPVSASSSTVLRTSPVTPTDVEDDNNRICNLTRLRQRRMSAQIKLSVIKKQMEESQNSPKERKPGFHLGRKKPDLLPSEIQGRSDLEEQAKSLTSMLDVLDSCITAQNLSPREVDPHERPILKKKSIYASDQSLQRPVQFTLDQKKDNMYSSSSDMSPKLLERDMNRTISIKSSVQKFAHKTLSRANRYLSRKSSSPSEEKDDPKSSNPSSPSSNLSEMTPDVIDMTNNNTQTKSISFADNGTSYPEPPEKFKTDYTFLTQTLPNNSKKGIFSRSNKNNILTSSFSQLEIYSPRISPSTSFPSLHLTDRMNKNEIPNLSSSQRSFLKSDSPVDSLDSSSSWSPTIPTKNISNSSESPVSRREVNPNALAQIEAFEELSKKFMQDCKVSQHL